MQWDAQPHFALFADLAVPPLAIPLAVQAPEREPMLHRDTRPPVLRGELTARQRQWQIEKEINRHKKKIERAYRQPWHILMKLIGEA